MGSRTRARELARRRIPVIRAEAKYVDPGQFLFGIIFGTLISVFLGSITVRGEVGDMASATQTLPPDAVPVEMVGQTTDELSRGLSMMERTMTDGQKVRIELVTDSMPTGDDLAEFHQSLIADGHHVSRPTAKIVGGLAVTSVVIKKGSPALALLVPIIPTVLILGLITFGIFRIEKIANALMPILVVSFAGLIVLAIILTRKPVLSAAEKIALRGKPKLLLASTVPLSTECKLEKLAAVKPEDMPHSGLPPVDFAQTEKEKGWKDFYKGNRVQASIDSTNYRIERRKVSKEAQDKLHASLKTDRNDLIQYQNVKSWAFAMGLITEGEAQLLYMIYGGENPSPENWEKRTLAEKVAGTQMADELLSAKIKSKLSPQTAFHDKAEGQERVWIKSGGGTVFSYGQMVSRREFNEENQKALDRGDMPATGEIQIDGKWESLPQTMEDLTPRAISEKHHPYRPPKGIPAQVYPVRASTGEGYTLYDRSEGVWFGRRSDTYQEAINRADRENRRLWEAHKALHPQTEYEEVEMNCVKCGERIASPSSFSSPEALREYIMTGVCEKCTRSISQEIFEPIFNGNGKGSELDLFPDSPEYLAQTVDMTGWRQKLDQTFQEAIARARRG